MSAAHPGFTFLVCPDGQLLRARMEQLFGAKVFLQTWVRVREGWSDDEAALRSLGYGD